MVKVVTWMTTVCRERGLTFQRVYNEERSVANPRSHLEASLRSGN